MKKLIIIGASDAGHEILEIVNSLNNRKREYDFLGFYDDFLKGSNIINNIQELGEKHCFELYFINSIGNIKNRYNTSLKLLKAGLSYATIISQFSYISPTAIINKGVVIYPNSSISTNVIIGQDTLINYNNSISHGVIISNNVIICPGCIIAGNVEIAENCFLGIGAKIIPKIKIAKNVTIGASSVLIEDANETGTYIGIPAKIKKNRGFYD